MVQTMPASSITDYWTGISAIIVAFVTCVAGPYILARLNLKWKGITPQEAGQAVNRVQFAHKIDDSIALAISIADDALERAKKVDAEYAIQSAVNADLKVQNDLLTNRVTLLEKAAARIPGLEADIRKCHGQIKNFNLKKRREAAKRRKQQ